MKFFAKLGHLILGILLGVCLVIGGVAAALFAGGGVGVVSNLTKEAFNPPEEVKKLSIAGYVGQVISVATKYQTSTFGELEDALGFNVTGELARIIGIDGGVLRKATVDTVFQDVLDGYTMTTLKEKFGIELPNMPIFTDSEFLSKPVTEAFNYLSSTLDFNAMTVKDLDAKFGIALTGDPFDSETVQNSKISELGETVQKLALKDFVTIITDAHVEMYDFEYVALNEGDDAATVLANWLRSEKFGNLFGILNGVAEPVPYNPESQGAFHYFADVTKTAEDGSSTVVSAKELQNRWITAYNAEHPDDKVYSFVDWAKKNPDKYQLFKENPEVNSDKSWCEENGIPSNWAPFALPKTAAKAEFDENRPKKSEKVLLYLSDATIGEINSKFSTMTLGNVIEIGENAHFLLKQVENSTLSTVATDLTSAIETTKLKDLLSLTTDADVKAWEAKYKTEAELEAWLVGKTAYKDDNETFDYFDTAEEQQAWIAATLAATGVKFYDEWEWKTANYGYFEELGSLDAIDKREGGKLFDEWARIIDRKTGTVNDTAALSAKYNTEIAEYLNGATEGTPEYAAAQSRYFAEKYDLYCYEPAARYCIAKPVKPEVIGAETPEKPTAASKMLLAIGGSTSKTISDRMDSLYVADIFGTDAVNSGIISLVSPYTTLNALPDELTNVLTTTHISTLLDKGILTIEGKDWNSMSEDEKKVFDCTIGQFLGRIVNNALIWQALQNSAALGG